MKVVSDSTPLIQLAMAERMNILFSLYNKILITEVYSEVVEGGLILEKEDAVIIKEHIGKRIQIKNPGSSSMHIIRNYSIYKVCFILCKRSII
jgi:predicted nucleic acid-binding protein